MICFNLLKMMQTNNKLMDFKIYFWTEPIHTSTMLYWFRRKHYVKQFSKNYWEKIKNKFVNIGIVQNNNL